MKQFGGKPTPEIKETYKKSTQWRNDKFENIEPIQMDFTIQSLPKMLYKQFFDKKGREPKKPIPIIPFDKEAFLKSDTETKIIWFGHSVVLLRYHNKTILIDPMFGPDASPIAPFSTQRFSMNALDIIDELPQIDLVLLTHDHYDHLDMESILKLKDKTRHYYVALGIKRHLAYWGVDESKVQEFDWWDSCSFEEIEITFTPTRHSSGRGIKDQARCLWGGWAFNNQKEKIWFSGDGGYGKHFKEIGEKLGPFDFAFMECGQYNKSWHNIHMYPEESVQAAVDAKVNKVMIVHWAGFSLAQHPWKEPMERFTQALKEFKLHFIAPRIGQLFSPPDEISDFWWEEFE